MAGWLDKYKDDGEMSYYQHGLDFKPKSIGQNGNTISPEEKYNEFLRLNEEVRYTPYRDRRGKGAKLTIGIGHLITPKEKKTGFIYGIPFKKALSDEQVNTILENDLKEKHDSMNDFLQENYNITANDLSDNKKYALLDLQYNSRKGLKAFPKFVDAVIKGDYNTQLQEYKRTFKEKGRTKPLKLRNETYLKNYVIPSVSEDIVTERIKSGKLQFVPDMESIQERAEKITDERFVKGGTVKHDNLGYWNPDNWGEVVEIDSPNITMRNVNIPLLGVSDEGDTKMMSPGKDYKFKGKKVTEYPVAQRGDVVSDISKFARDYTSSQNFMNLSRKMGDSEELIKERKKEILMFNPKRDIIYDYPVRSAFFVNNGKMVLGDKSTLDGWSYHDVVAHEFGHLGYEDRGKLELPRRVRHHLTNTNKSFKQADSRAVSFDNPNIQHDIAPQENRADLFWLREQLKDSGIYDSVKGGEFTKEHLDKFKRSGNWNRIQRLYKDDDIIWMMNNIAENKTSSSSEYPIAKYGINEFHQLQDFTNKPSKNWLQKYS